jgi:hypothetical protein
MWRPATELRGEGIFLTLNASLLTSWEGTAAVVAVGETLRPVFEEWWQNRGELPFPGMRYVLLHSFAHVLMREMSLDAGYSSSALRELARPDRLGQIVQRAFKGAGFCASDPLCSGGQSSHSKLNGAACHACLLVAETSCEIGNKLLDRGVVVRTLADDALAFFDAR